MHYWDPTQDKKTSAFPAQKWSHSHSTPGTFGIGAQQYIHPQNTDLFIPPLYSSKDDFVSYLLPESTNPNWPKSILVLFFIERQFSMDLFCFCTFCEQKHCLYFSQPNFSRIFVWWITLEDRYHLSPKSTTGQFSGEYNKSNISMNREKACLLPIVKIQVL